MDFVIRKSTKNDIKEILGLIQVNSFTNHLFQLILLISKYIFKELADYEKMPDGPKLTEKDLEEDGFGAKPFFECLVAYDPAKPEKLIGFVLFFYTYSTWEGKAVFMEDLYVTPTYRGKGIGTNLWKGVVQVSSNSKTIKKN